VAEVPEVPAWLDRLEIEGGVGWWRQIEAQLDRAEFLIIVMTPAALASAHTRQEWRAARQRGVCVYPVKGVPDAQLDYAALPRWMAAAHFYDPDREWPSLAAHLRRGCLVARVPFMAPPLPAAHVPRPRELQAVVDLLLAPGHADPVAVSAALRGSGGFGEKNHPRGGGVPRRARHRRLRRRHPVGHARPDAAAAGDGDHRFRRCRADGWQHQDGPHPAGHAGQVSVRRCCYAICSSRSRPQACAYFLSVAREGECFPVASERSRRATAGGCVPIRSATWAWVSPASCLAFRS